MESPQLMPIINQYHGAACKTCRRRGRKCTRELPTCQSCKNRGSECEGYELKWAGLASRGYLAGKDASKISNFKKAATRKSSKAANQQQAREEFHPEIAKSLSEQHDSPDPLPDSGVLFPTWTSFDFDLPSSPIEEEMFQVQSDESVLYESDPLAEEAEVIPSPNLMNSLILPPRPALNFFDIPPNLGFIMDYHLQRVSAKLCVNNNALINPYRQYVYPLALQKPALLYACAAMSSVHYSTCEQNEDFYVEALRLRGKALSRLQESMWSREGALDESNLATILMLILCDMCMGGHSNFEMYFTLAKSLMDARGQMRTYNNFVEQYISWLDIMSCASTSRKPVFNSNNIRSFRDTLTDWNHDVVPCAADVFDIFREIVDLYKNNPETADITSQIENLKTRVIMCPPRTERGMPWYHLTEAYRHAVLLHMSLLFERDDDEDEVAWLVSSIIHHAKSTPSSNGWAAQLLWPLFHAGLKITDTRRQDWMRGMFREMQLSGGFRNVATARETLEKVWNCQFSGKYVDLLVQGELGDMLVV